MKKRNLERDNIRITLTAEKIRANRISTSFIPNPVPGQVAEHIVVEAEPTVTGPFLQYVEDPKDVTNFLVSVLEALVKEVPDSDLNEDLGSLADVVNINLGFESDDLL